MSPSTRNKGGPSLTPSISALANPWRADGASGIWIHTHEQSLNVY